MRLNIKIKILLPVFILTIILGGCMHIEGTKQADDNGIGQNYQDAENIKSQEGNAQKKPEKSKRDIVIAHDIEEGLFILVNKENPIDANYVPDDLVSVSYYAKNRSPAGRTMRQEAAKAFDELAKAAEKAGYEIVATTAYRSYDFQNTLYTNYVKQYGKEQADTFSARPGASEHQTGLAVDVSSPSVNYELLKSYGDTEEGKWLTAHAHEFGFIIRYLDGRENITGYMYEPWHIRYVGKIAAAEIKDADITLEEYIEKVIEK